MSIMADSQLTTTLNLTASEIQSLLLCAPDVPIEEETYYDSCVKYSKLTDRLMRRQADTFILGGFGCFCKVKNDAFCVEYAGEDSKKALRLNRGVHKIKQVILVAKGGYVTYDAIEWLAQQNITLYLMDFNGEL